MMRNFDLDDIHASNMLTCSQTLKIAGFLTSAAIVCLFSLTMVESPTSRSRSTDKERDYIDNGNPASSREGIAHACQPKHDKH